MARVSAAEVAEIIEVDATITLTPFITVANELVTEACTNSDYSTDRLKEIERWLSAHFYAIRDPRAKTQKAGSVSQAFFGKTDLLLNVTRYGQMAMLLDTEGNLAALSKRAQEGKKRSVGVTWLGTGDSEGNDDSD